MIKYLQKKSLEIPLSIDEQIKNLKQINLKIEDEDYARDVLSRISYFRLIKAYGLGLKPKNGNYSNGVTFEKIVKIYEFNSRLRGIIFPLIEDVEINLRCKLANYISCTYGNLGHTHPENFMDGTIYERMIDDYNKEVERGKSPFIHNFRDNYIDGEIPFYAAVELFTFGMLSKLFSNLKKDDKKEIALEFGIGYTYLESWFKSITGVRNICAHYGRLYNMKLPIKPELYKQYPKNDNYRIFAVLLTLKHLVANRSLWLSFNTDLTAIIGEYSKYISLDAIGFPANWDELLNNNDK